MKSYSKKNSKGAKEVYYPGVTSGSLKSQKSEPVRKHIQASRENRKLSLPDINRHKLKKANSSSYYSNAQKLKSDSNFSNRNLRNPKNPDIGHSFVSFNVKNSSAKIRSMNASVTPHTNGKNAIDKVLMSVNNTENQTKNVRESFESCTTEGKKTSQAMDKLSSNRLAEEAYGDSRQADRTSTNPKQSSKENINNRPNTQLSNIPSETIGEDSLPEIANSVVEDSLPFKGQDTNQDATIKIDFSKASGTNYMQKTNEGFYSSFKSNKRNETSQMNHRKPIDNGLPSLNGTNINKTENHPQSAAYEDSVDLDRAGNARVWNGQISHESSHHPNSNMYNIIKASTGQNSNSISVNKNSKNSQMMKHRKNNRSKASNKNDDQPWFSYELSSKHKNGHKSGKIMSNKIDTLDSGKSYEFDTVEMEKIENNLIFNEGETLRRGLIDVNKTYDHVKTYKKKKPKPNTRGKRNFFV